jgi:hypothetical protein
MDNGMDWMVSVDEVVETADLGLLRPKNLSAGGGVNGLVPELLSTEEDNGT